MKHGGDPCRYRHQHLSSRSSAISGAFEALSRFAESGYVDILIPDVVAEEFTSLPADKAQAVAGIRKALTELRRGTPDDFAPTIEKFESDVAEEFRRIDADAEAIFTNWRARTQAKLIDVGDDHARRVLAKYFDGQLPFKSRKSRADFPDAFIVEVLTDLAEQEVAANCGKPMWSALASIRSRTS